MTFPEVELAGGVHLVGTPLFCDPSEAAELAFVSHATFEPLPLHRRVVATDRTVKLLGRRVSPGVALACSYRRPFALGELELELFPSGYRLGAAQLRARTAKGDVVYAGRLLLDETRTAERAQIVPCDVLVLDASGATGAASSTRASVEKSIVTFVEQALRDGATPVLFANPVGTAQEVCMLLSERSIPVRAHARVYEVCRAYRAAGLEIPNVRSFQGTPAHDECLVFPLGMENARAIRSLRRPRTALVSARLPPPAPCNAVLPLPEHASAEELARVVDASRAARVYTVGDGAQALAKALRRPKLEAIPLSPPEQMKLL